METPGGGAGAEGGGLSMLDLDMGKYVAFVWPAYAITAFVLIWMTADALLRARRWRREAERLQGEGEDTR